MRAVILSLIFALGALAADAPKPESPGPGPGPLTAEQKEQVSRQVIALLQAQNDALRSQLAVMQAQVSLEAAVATYRGNSKCDFDAVTKEWKCPVVALPSPPAPAAPTAERKK